MPREGRKRFTALRKKFGREKPCWCPVRRPRLPFPARLGAVLALECGDACHPTSSFAAKSDNRFCRPNATTGFAVLAEGRYAGGHPLVPSPHARTPHASADAPPPPSGHPATLPPRR